LFKVFPNYILEKKKVTNINKKIKELGLQEGEYTIFYLNFTPAGSYLWNITDLKPEDCDSSMYMNKATSSSRSDKVKKYYKEMFPEESKQFEYIYQPEIILKKEYVKRYVMPLVEKKIVNKGLGWLFDE
jgi:hypothetical protein